MVVVVAVSVVAPLLLLVVVLIKCLGCLRKKEGFKTFENEDARMEARINPGFAMGQDVDDRDQTMSTTIQIEPLPELLAESTPRKPKIACVEKTKQEAAFKLVVINNPHPFPRRQLTYLKEIGNGWFGQVLESDAEHITTGIPLSRVVAKVLRDDASNSEKKLFLEDVVPYRELEHSNVLRLLGQCTESAPYLMILEYAQMGDLKTCVKNLKDRADVMTQNYQVVKFAIDAASGLACLHRHGYIHQDFAARNCVVMADYTVKVGDYGISEDVFKADYYVSGKESLPIRWMAPETLSQQSGSWQTAVITREANIWSFGVLLWEVVMFGKQPYGNMPDDQVLQTVIADRMVKLPEPDVSIQFKDRIVEVMLFCWLNPGERPSIEDAHGLLQRLYEIVAGDQAQAENFEKKWSHMIPHEARIVSARPQPKQQKRPTSASFDNNFVQEPKSEPQQALTEQSTKPGDLVSVKIEDMSTSVVNGGHIAVNMQPSLAGNLAQLPTPSRHTLPAHMTSTPIMDLAPTPNEPDISQKQQKSGSGSRTSRKIEDEFSIAQVASTKSNSGSMASPVPSEEKTPDVLIDVPQDDTDADLQGALGKEENVPVSDQFDLLGGKTAISATQQASSVDVLEAFGEPVQGVQNKPNTQEENKQEQAFVDNKDPFADLFGQGDIADQIKPVSSQPNSSSELLPTNGNQSLLSESSPKCDAESPVSGFDEPDTKAELVGKQTASSDTRPDTDVEPQNFLSNDIDLVSSHNFQAESIIPNTFHPSERSAGEPVSKGENVKPSDLALDNGTSGYETPADQSAKSDSIEENTSGAESSSDSAVCVSSPELADAPSSFDVAAPSHEKVGTCVEYVSDDESKSSSSESDSSSDSSNSGSSYVCEESRRIIQVTDLDADDDDSDNLDEHQDNISDEVTDSDEDLDLRLASELYLSKGVSSPRVFERPPLETIPEDVMPSPSDTSSIDLKFDAHFDDVFASQDNFEWDDFMGESIVGRDRTSYTPKASFDMSDWLMDGDSLSYRSSGSIQSPLESVSPDVLGTSDPSIRLSTASTSEQPSLGPTDATFSVETSVSSAPMLEADVTNQKLPSEQQTEESADPSDNFKGLGGRVM
ncbi:serine-rich adhesin for platelets-like isoform X2 [Haliotis rubra]|uniref:serine-rich adhesin for platelets-like isoform X2 n=1 Tax=Haliotis rubra TaxID=36100 RepID=UPI001EE554AE|nr:serine-rich adhesin for platelets-like isoform X2 [Haliotis rubra]